MFGKPIAAYLSFQKVVLALLAAVGLARLGLSLAGVATSLVAWVSMNLVGWLGAFYYGAASRKAGFDRYKQLLPLALFQAIVFHTIAVIGILLAIGGMPNIYAAPEFSGPAAQSQWLHAAAHLTIGMVAATLIWWGAASLARLVATKISR